MKKEHVYNTFFDEETWKIVLQSNKDLMEDYLLELKQNKKSEQTISQYKSDLKGIMCYICNHLDNRDILTLTKRDFRSYSLFLTEDCHLSNARHNRLLSSLRSLLNFAENEDDLEYSQNNARRVKGLPKESVREIFFLTDEQIMKLKNKLIELEEYQKATLLLLAYDSAGRKNELRQVQKHSFLDETKSSTNKVIGKRRKIFSLLYFSGTKECAKLWLQQRGNDSIDSLFVVGNGENRHEADIENIYEWFLFMRKLLSEMEGKEMDFGPHSIRHSSLQSYKDCSHYFLKEMGMTKGFPIEKLRLIANHSDISTTQGYLKDESLNELEEMFNIKLD
jgi:site-specific recombinase XerC